MKVVLPQHELVGELLFGLKKNVKKEKPKSKSGRLKLPFGWDRLRPSQKNILILLTGQLGWTK